MLKTLFIFPALLICNLVNGQSRAARPLEEKLSAIWQNDQEYRLMLDSVSRLYGEQSKEMYALRDTISHYDSVNLSTVAAILNKYGWPDTSIVGVHGGITMFYVLQHADTQTQEKYLPLVRKAVKAHKLLPYALAMLEDRVHTYTGKKQRYGSQILADAKGVFVSPVTDPDHLDERRAQMGLEPMFDYVGQFHLTWDVDEYKKELPELMKRQKVICQGHL